MVRNIPPILSLLFGSASAALWVTWFADSVGWIDINFNGFEPMLGILNMLTAIALFFWQQPLKRLVDSQNMTIDTVSPRSKVTAKVHLGTVKEYQQRMKTKYRIIHSEKYIDIPIRKRQNGQLLQLRRSKSDIIEEVYDHGPRIIIGAPGSGKSTLLQDILFILLDAYIESFTERGTIKKLPLYIELRDRDAPTDFYEMIEYWWFKSGIKHHKSIHELLADNAIFLLLDGLNELSPPEKKRYEQIFSGLQVYSHSAYEGPILVTCRITDYTQELSLPIGVFEIDALGAEELVSFAHNYLDETDAIEFLSRIVKRPERVDLTSNILSLKMLKDIYDYGHKRLPNTRPMLYNTYINEIYDEFKNPMYRIQMPKEDLKESWQRLAYRMMVESKSDGVSRAEARRMAQKSWLQSNSSVDEGIALNILTADYNEDSLRDDSIIKFFHRTMYEHLVTEHTVKFVDNQLKVKYADLDSLSRKEKIDLLKNFRASGIASVALLPTILAFYLRNHLDQEVEDVCRKAIIYAATESRSGAGVYIILSLLLFNAIRMYQQLLEDPMSDITFYKNILKSDLSYVIQGPAKQLYINWRSAQLSFQEKNNRNLHIFSNISSHIFDPRVITVTLQLKEYLRYKTKKNDTDSIYETGEFTFYETTVHTEYATDAEKSFSGVTSAYAILKRNMEDASPNHDVYVESMISYLTNILSLMKGDMEGMVRVQLDVSDNRILQIKKEMMHLAREISLYAEKQISEVALSTDF